MAGGARGTDGFNTAGVFLPDWFDADDCCVGNDVGNKVDDVGGVVFGIELLDACWFDGCAAVVVTDCTCGDG